MNFACRLALAVAGVTVGWCQFAGHDAALASCSPTAVNNVVADCTGVTTNQQLGAPGTSAGTQGYGGSSIVGATISVLSGASVTGTQSGLRFNSGIVVNDGSITGTGADGVQGTTTLTLTNNGDINAPAGSAVHATIVTLNNFGTLRGAVGVTGNTSAVITNSGTITGATNAGIIAGTTVRLANTGTISGNTGGVVAGTVATVNNTGSIIGAVNGMTANSATVTNSGSIRGGTANGITTVTTVDLTNSGTISGVIGVSVGSTGTIINSGTIVGTGGTAIQFNRNGTAAADTLTVLAGARFVGAINFGGGADTLNLPGGSMVLDIVNFDAALSTINAGGSPVVVSGGRIAVADVSGVGASDRALTDITGWISSVLPDAPVFEPAPSGASAFAAMDAAMPNFDQAFAGFPADALGYQPAKAPMFKGGNVAYADGSTVWAKGFAGRRDQQSSGLIGSATTGYGAAFGYERRIIPDLSLGILLGASTNKTGLDGNNGGNDADTLFGGVYGRLTRAATFLDLSLIGGQLDNKSTRTINVGLATETASASYKGRFINPALALGHRFALGNGYTLTPAVKGRYLVAQFDSYTETGSTSNLTVDSRTVRAFEERGELTLAKVAYLGSSRVTSRISGGVLGQQRVGSAAVNMVLLGQNVATTLPGQTNVSGYFGGAGLDWQIGRIALFAAGEATATNDGTRTYVGQGGIRVGW